MVRANDTDTVTAAATMAASSHGGSLSSPELQDAIHNLLNTREQLEFKEMISDYQNRRKVEEFAETLQILLDTPAKRHLIGLLRKVIPHHDLQLFDQRMMGVYEGSYNNNINNAGSIPRSSSAGLPLPLPPEQIDDGPGTSASGVSLPVRYYQSVPSRTRNYKRQAAGGSLNHRSLASSSAAGTSSWDPSAMSNRSNDTKRIYMEQTGSPHTGLGFSIRGGIEHGIGVYVSHVEVESVAEKQGLTPGDQILTVNDISMLRVTHSEAARIIKSSKKLEMEVRHMGRVPGSFETHQKYTWVDALGRTVSPPPEVDRTGRYDHTSEERKSDLMLLKGSDERKVNLVVNDSKTLGIMIRGGSEFGLGLYLTGVDHDSIAESAGLKIGDQILDVNGQSFLDITHAEAVKVLKSSKHLMMTIKDVGKLPYARTTYDHTQWITGNKLPKSQGSRSYNDVAALSNGSSGGSTHDAIFTKGAGSQLMYSSTMSSHTTQIGLLKEHAKQLLKEQERTSMNYFLQEYSTDAISVEALVMALSKIFNTPAKFSMMFEIRGLVTPRDIDKFDALVAERESLAFKQATGDEDSDKLSDASLDSRLGKSDVLQNGTDTDDDMHALHQAIDEISDLDPPAGHAKQNGSSKSRGKSKSTSSKLSPPGTHSNNTNFVVAEVHRPPTQAESINDAQLDDSGRSPSEDSGVDINGTHPAPETSRVAHQRVTIMNQEPIIIDDTANRKPVHQKVSRWTEERVPNTEKTPLKIPTKNKVPSSDGDALRKRVLLSTVKPYRTKPYLSTGSSGAPSFVPLADSKKTTLQDIKLDQNNSNSRTSDRESSSSDKSLSPSSSRSFEKSQDSSSSRLLSKPHRLQLGENHSILTTKRSSSYGPVVSSKSYPDIRHSSDATTQSSRQRPPGEMILPPGHHLTNPTLNTKNTSQLASDQNLPSASLPEGHVKKIPVHRTKRSLGIAIEGGANTRQPLPRISTIQESGSAHDARDLKVGQIILKVNGKSLDGLGHLECAKVIAHAFKDKTNDHMELTVLEVSTNS